MSNRDFYETLGLDRSASSSEIKKAYLKLAKKYHPDQNKGDADAEHKFKEISAAYDILKDEQKRAAYDRFGHDAFMNGGGANAGRAGHGAHGFHGHARGHGGGHGGGFGGAEFHDMFGDFFSDFMGGGARAQRASSKVRGSDLTTKLEISLEEAFNGAQKELKFTTQAPCSPCSGKGTKDKDGMTNCDMCGGAGTTRMQQGFFAIEQTCQKCRGMGQVIKNPCHTCHGAGRVQKEKKLIINIPAGVEDGVRIRNAGEGEAGMRGGSSGDLYVFVSVKPHKIFKTNGADLHFKLPIKFTTAALGGTVKVPTIEGKEIELKVPAGSETGDQVRLGGKGMPVMRSSARGDMYAHVFIETPKKLTKKQKELLEQLDKELGEGNAKYDEGGFFSKMKNIWT